jgi:hypothetical protein
LLSFLSLFFTACDSFDDTKIESLLRNPELYADKEVIVVGEFSREISLTENNDGHYIAYLSDLQDYRIVFECENTGRMIHKSKYVVNATFVYDNATKKMHLKCLSLPMQR